MRSREALFCAGSLAGGTGQWIVPHLHTGGDFWATIGAAAVFGVLAIQVYRRFGASGEPETAGIADAVDEVYEERGLDVELETEPAQEPIPAGSDDRELVGA